MARFEDLENAGFRIKYDDAGAPTDIVDSRGASAGFALVSKTLTGVIENITANGKKIPGLPVFPSGSRPKLLVFGCSIAQQCNVYMHSGTSTTSGDHKAGVSVLNVANGALFTPGQIISYPLYNARIAQSVILSIAANALTLTNPLIGFVRTGSSVTITTTGTVPSLDQGYGAINAAVALLGGPVEVLPSYGYGGAVCNAMICDLDRDLRYYMPQYVAFHMFENDLTGLVSSGAATLDQLKAWARQCARTALAFGAIPIVCSSMPYYNGAAAGIPAIRAPDFDGLLSYLCAPVSNGLSQFQIDVPGSYGIDLSTGWLSTTNPTWPRAPQAGWTDGVHPVTAKRFAVGQFAVPVLKQVLPPAGSLLDYCINPREIAAMSGTGGANVSLQGGSIVPASHVAGVFGAALMTTSRNADGSLKMLATWPGAAARNTDYVFDRYPFWIPGCWAGSTQRFKVYARIRINQLVGVGQVYAEAVMTTGNEDHSGSFGIDMAKSLPADGSTILLETPHFALGANATSITAWFVIKPTDAGSPANALADIDVLELGIVPVTPEVPHTYI